MKNIQKHIELHIRGGKKNCEYIEIDNDTVDYIKGKQHCSMVVNMGKYLHVEEYIWIDEPNPLMPEEIYGWWAVNAHPLLDLGWLFRIEIPLEG